MNLCNATLKNLPENVGRPTYDRKALTPGIVHIGVGNFHRAHQAWYLHQLMQKGQAFDWAIIGGGVRPSDRDQREKLEKQDYLTTLIELDPEGTSAKVVGSMIDYLPVDDNCASLIEKMSDPAIRIVSLTVTEGGYYINAATNDFDFQHADILHDVANPEHPITAFGAIVVALKHRRENGVGPLTCLSCDNLQGNGNILRRTVVSLARLTDPDVSDWIDQNCSFPNSMVDCIVPATGSTELSLAKEFGMDDAVPVTHENFRQWVIEDDFCAGRPDWDLAGATFSADVQAYEKMKIRILNGGHQIISNIGELFSFHLISQCMENLLISSFFRKVTELEIVPTVEHVPNLSSTQYVELIAQRFSNPRILDTVRRVAFDGSSRHTGFLLPTIRDAIVCGSPVSGLALTEALWARMCHGTRDDGSTITANDPHWDELTKVARIARENPEAWLRQYNIYSDLADNADFAICFTRWLRIIWDEGTERAIQHYLKG